MNGGEALALKSHPGAPLRPVQIITRRDSVTLTANLSKTIFVNYSIWNVIVDLFLTRLDQY